MEKEQHSASPLDILVRARFEQWISSPPFERDVNRFGDGSYKPGRYRDLDVDLAWCAWLDATTIERDRCATVCSLEGQRPSTLWSEPGCWTHAAQVCAEKIMQRSNAALTGAAKVD